MAKRQALKYRAIITIVLTLFAVCAAVMTLRFVFGGPEDAWICEKGQWIMHGKPSVSPPSVPCEN